MNAASYTLGLDLARASFDAAIAPDGVDPKQWRQLPNTHLDWSPDSEQGASGLLTWMAQVAPQGHCARVVVESTGGLSRRVAWLLAEHGLAVAIVNPRRPKAFGASLGVRDKTDRIDCAILALYGAVHRPEPTRLRSRQADQLRQLTRLRQSYLEDQNAWHNRLEELPEGPARQVIVRTLRHLEKQVKAVEDQIDASIEEDPVLAGQVTALQQIHGIGQVTARVLTAELGDLRTYRREQLAALAGLFPKVFNSGRTVARRPRLAKGGGGRLRRVLYMCATALLKSGGPMQQFIERLQHDGKSPMCILGALMRKLLLVCRAVMVNDGHYCPSLITH